MSLSIDTEKIITVYALGEWHPVMPGSVDIDSFELKHFLDSPQVRKNCEEDPSERRGDRIDYYEMGALYSKTEPEFSTSWMNAGQGERMHTMKTPSGAAGFCFMTPEGTRKAFSLVECKAFEYEED